MIIYCVTMTSLVKGQHHVAQLYAGGDYTTARAAYASAELDVPRCEVLIEARSRHARRWVVLGRRTYTHPVASTERKFFFSDGE